LSLDSKKPTKNLFVAVSVSRFVKYFRTDQKIPQVELEVSETEAPVMYQVLKAIYSDAIDPGVSLSDAILGVQLSRKVCFLFIPTFKACLWTDEQCCLVVPDPWCRITLFGSHK
jgi:hypothetical protein